jgi:hypothetical protein
MVTSLRLAAAAMLMTLCSTSHDDAATSVESTKMRNSKKKMAGKN